jgi:Zn-finger nucleic acid-binding protein
MEKSCPKCRAKMHTIERSGVIIDQCGNCRGIFLDRGELEQLVDAEIAYYASSAALRHPVEPPRPPRPPAAPAFGSPNEARSRAEPDQYGHGDGDRYKDGSYRQNRYDDHYPPRREKRKSFLEELFS